MATGKTSRYRYNVKPETILSQARKGDTNYPTYPKSGGKGEACVPLEKVQRLNGSGQLLTA
jgi:hypothetical protein